MLIALNIKNFAIIEDLAIEFQPHMTVLTGETGAGKSIIVDTLDIVLGARVDSEIIGHAKDKCEIIASFDITGLQDVSNWLTKQELTSDNNECIIRRSISHDGKTRSTINDYPCTQQLVRELGGLLVNIHGQHEHQSLLRNDRERDLLDAFAGHKNLCVQVASSAKELLVTKNELEKLTHSLQERDARLDLLHYQITELDTLNLVNGEIEQLEQELKRFSNAEKIIKHCQLARDIITNDREDTTLLSNLFRVQNQLEKIDLVEPAIQSSLELLNNARIDLEVVSDNLRAYLTTIDPDPERLNCIATRLNTAYDIARKHHIQPEALPNLHINLLQELASLEKAELDLEQLAKKTEQLEKLYHEATTKLSASRSQAAVKLGQLITEKMQSLGMIGGKLAVELLVNNKNIISHNGLEEIEFLVSVNPGQPLKPLRKVASGGELSRISLAIQVVTAETAPNLTLIFDEVDVGIGGKTAEIVGELLRKIGLDRQVICITHLPQVAACGNQHIKVAKDLQAKTTTVSLNYLDNDARVLEIARMLGGINITNKTIAHAEEMLYHQTNGK